VCVPAVDWEVLRSERGGVDAMERFATGFPAGVNLSSGSWPRMPHMVITVSLANGFSFLGSGRILAFSPGLRESRHAIIWDVGERVGAILLGELGHLGVGIESEGKPASWVAGAPRFPVSVDSDHTIRRSAGTLPAVDLAWPAGPR